MSEEQRVEEVAGAFQWNGAFRRAARYGSGHINDSYCVVVDDARSQAGGPVRFLLQRINGHVFKQPAALMENIQRVTLHLAEKAAGEQDAARRVLTLIPTRDGQAWHKDAQGDAWRAYRFIEGARSFDAVESEAQAYQAARAFGRFQRLLADLPEPRLHDTIPDFHHTPKRFHALQRAIAADVAGRVALAEPEIAFALARASLTGVLLEAGLPERITHNDTKLNNVMLDDATGEGLCVIDLDTVMPGIALYDFGDMVRTSTSPAEEDERDLSKVAMQFSMFEALVRGYLSPEGAGNFLSTAEIDLLAFAGKLSTLEQGIRFLTDYLSGDPYYKVHRDGHNLDRCRTQLALVASIERQEESMWKLVKALKPRASSVHSR